MHRRGGPWSRVQLEPYQSATGPGLDLERRALVRVFQLLCTVDPYGLLGVFEVQVAPQRGWTLYAASLAGWAVVTWEVDPGERVAVLHSLAWA